jgi:hypothetical protein
MGAGRRSRTSSSRRLGEPATPSSLRSAATAWTSVRTLELDEDALAGVRRLTLIVSAQDSPGAYRLVNARLSGALPFTRTVLVPGGHFIDPAYPAVLDFVDRVATGPDAWA